MSDLFRLQAVDSISRRYGSPLKLGGTSFWPPILALTVLSMLAVATIFLFDYTKWELEPGITVLEESPIVVSAPYRSVITRLLVREGQHVSAGTPLLELKVVSLSDDAQDPIARQREQLDKLLTSRRKANALVQTNGQISLSLTRSKIGILNAQAKGVSADLVRQREETARLGEFLSRLKDPRFLGALPKTQILDYESRYSSAASSVSSLERQLLELRSEVLIAEEAQGKLVTDLALAQSEAEEFEGQHEVDRLGNVMEKGGTVYASTSGVVANILARRNAEIDSDEPILSLINPSSPVVGIIMASGDQAAFLSSGEIVNLRFHSWSYRTKGEVPARVKDVSRIPVHLTRQQLRGSGDTKPLYRVTLTIKSDEFIRVSEGRTLIAGLGFDGVILKETSPLIDLVLPNWRLREKAK